MAHVSFDAKSVKVFFPFEPYDVQKKYVESVIEALTKGHNAILESPTGTGKTLSLLCSSLAWLKKQSNQKSVIYYTSRTHTQLGQATKELKRTAYAKEPAVLMGSRARMCLNEEVRTIPGGEHLINRACRNAIAKNACQYYTNYEQKLEALDVNNVNDIEELANFGRNHQCCPYYASRKLAETKATIIFLPYNYLLDTSLQKGIQLKLSDSVILFDEAHNIESVLKDAVSGSFTCDSLEQILESCLKLPEKLTDALTREKGFTRYGFVDKERSSIVDEFAKKKTKPDKPEKEPKKSLLEELSETLTTERLRRVSESINKLLAQIKSVLKLDERAAMSKLQHLLDNSGISYHTSHDILGTLDSMSTFWSVAGVMRPEYVAKFIVAITRFREFVLLMHPESCLSISQRDNHRAKLSKYYTAYFQGIYAESIVAKKGDLKGWELFLWCLHPSVGMKRVLDESSVRRPRSLIITSGTLKPLHSIAKQLDIEIPIQEEFDHVIGRDNLKIVIIGQSPLPASYSLESHYEALKKDQYAIELGKTLARAFKVLPFGTLVFFQSYTSMNKVIRYWKATSTWRDMSNVSKLYVEERDQNSLERDIRSYKQDLSDPRSSPKAVFFGVCRGKLSEGTNLEGNYCRTVIMTGFPFPSIRDPKVIATKDFHSSGLSMGGQIWYNQQMTRALNQTIGRIIRGKDDFGMILLCDPRYVQYKHSISKWAQVYYPAAATKFEAFEAEAKDFFLCHGIEIKQTAASVVGCVEMDSKPAKNPLAVIEHSKAHRKSPAASSYSDKGKDYKCCVCWSKKAVNPHRLNCDCMRIGCFECLKQFHNKPCNRCNAMLHKNHFKQLCFKSAFLNQHTAAAAAQKEPKTPANQIKKLKVS